MPIRIGEKDIKNIYCGTKQITKIYCGTTLLYSVVAGIIGKNPINISNKFTDIHALAVDNDFLYVSAGATATSVDKLYKIDKKTSEITQLSTPFTAYTGSNESGNRMNNRISAIHIYGKYVLCATYGMQYAWYDKTTNTFSSLYELSTNISCCYINRKYSYLAYYPASGAKLVRINNETKEHKEFGLPGVAYQLIADNKNVYTYDSNGNCYVFNEKNETVGKYADKPSSVTGVSGSENGICQNSTYVFSACKTSDSNSKFNRIMVTDKTTPNISVITTPASDSVQVSCNENYLFVVYGNVLQESHLYIYDLSSGLNSYTTVDLKAHTGNTGSTSFYADCVVSDNDYVYMSTNNPDCVCTYTLSK